MMWILIWMLSAGAQVPAAQTETAPVPATTLAAQAWLFMTYPALAQRRLQIETIGDAYHQRLAVSEPSGPEVAGAATPRPVLQVDAHFTRAGVLERLSARGAAVGTPQLDALRTWAATRTRTLAEVDLEVRRTGGTFGPNSAAAVVQVSQRLSAVLKAPATLLTPVFERTPDLGPVWVVEVRGARRTYRAVFEPFTGQLIAVTPK